MNDIEKILDSALDWDWDDKEIAIKQIEELIKKKEREAIEGFCKMLEKEYIIYWTPGDTKHFMEQYLKEKD